MSGPRKPGTGDKAVPANVPPSQSSHSQSSPAKPFPAKPCPICRKPSVERFRPFCSKRCADVDLNRWLSGSYAIPGQPEEDEDGQSD